MVSEGSVVVVIEGWVSVVNGWVRQASGYARVWVAITRGCATVRSSLFH